MKFGQRIRTSLYPEWQEKYLDYNGLKKDLKSKTKSAYPDERWDDNDEREFVNKLERELEKCEEFQLTKAEELSERIESLEKTVHGLVKAYDSQQHHGDDANNDKPSASQLEAQDGQDAAAMDGGSDDEDEGVDDDDTRSEASYDETFKDMEEEVATLVADVHDLALYTKLNFTGFMKIVKKHDKVTGYTLKPEFSSDYLDKHPFYKYNYDGLIVKLSRLFDLVRTRGHPIEGDSAAGGSQNAFVRSTTKYWVHEDNIIHLKLAILKHLPVLVFNPKKPFEAKDAAITSIYFDNEDLELYLGRLEKTEGAEAIRLRWYGDVDQKMIFVERKTHREDWTGEKSVKARFGIAEHKVNDFIAGRLTMDAEFDELVKKGKKSQKEVEGMKQLANEVQYAIITRRLKPVMRSFYNRTAFQLPGDARVRISLDTELTMVREDDFDGKPRAGNNWRRTDIGIDYPFEQLPKEDKELFRYAVLEVKLQTQLGQEPPDWIRDLIASHLVEAVPKFSKFIHGCATLLPERVELIPYWAPQYEKTDIKKPVNPKSRVQIERPHSAAHSSASNNTSIPTSPTPSQPAYYEPVSEGEDDDEYLTHTASDEARRLGLPPDAHSQAEAAKQFRENKLREEAERTRANGEDSDEDPARRPSVSQKGKQYGPRLDIDPLQPSSAFDKKLSLLDPKSMQKLFKAKDSQDRPKYGDDDDEEEEDEEHGEQPANYDPTRVEYTREFQAPDGKRIATMVRIEPKVFFANERTFLKWLGFAVLLAGVATTLLNFIHVEDTVGLISAGCFTFTSLLALVYAGGMYAYRVVKLRKREAINYHDPYGPTALCVTLIASILVNVILRLKEL